MFDGPETADPKPEAPSPETLALQLNIALRQRNAANDARDNMQIDLMIAHVEIRKLTDRIAELERSLVQAKARVTELEAEPPKPSGAKAVRAEE